MQVEGAIYDYLSISFIRLPKGNMEESKNKLMHMLSTLFLQKLDADAKNKILLGRGFFGGEGFIMQRITGYGMVFLEIDGYRKEYNLGVGESIIVDTGYLAAMSDTCTMDIQLVQGAKNIFFGGEGLFHTRITGPGKVYIQSMPVINTTNVIALL